MQISGNQKLNIFHITEKKTPGFDLYNFPNTKNYYKSNYNYIQKEYFPDQQVAQIELIHKSGKDENDEQSYRGGLSVC